MARGRNDSRRKKGDTLVLTHRLHTSRRRPQYSSALFSCIQKVSTHLDHRTRRCSGRPTISHDNLTVLSWIRGAGPPDALGDERVPVDENGEIALDIASKFRCERFLCLDVWRCTLSTRKLILIRSGGTNSLDYQLNQRPGYQTRFFGAQT